MLGANDTRTQARDTSADVCVAALKFLSLFSPGRNKLPLRSAFLSVSDLGIPTVDSVFSPHFTHSRSVGGNIHNELYFSSSS